MNCITLDYNAVSADYICFLNSVLRVHEPFPFEEVKNDPHWMNAMQEEIRALQGNNTWIVVDLPKGKQTIGCKWVCKVIYNVDGSLDRYKARLVVKGYT